MAGAERHKLRQYLLGQLTEAEAEEVEVGLLTEPDFAEEYDIVVDEVIDDYVAGRLKGEDLKQVEEHFFKSQQRRNKLKFALALKQRKSEMVTIKGHKQKSYRPYLAIAASILLAVGGFSIWRALSSRSEVDKGLAALQSAFRYERPLESRISGFTYAAFISTRGPGDEKFDNNDLSLAELTLRQELKDRPSPAAHYALGKVFLAKKDFDGAIKEFDEAFKGDPNNALLYSDLGAAWLEKGKTDLGKDSGKGMEELGRSGANLTKALEFNPNLLEARFNRALCREYLKFGAQAAEDWREYLRRDATSLWAEEARQKLRFSEEQNKRTSENKEQLVDDFLTAYQARNDAAAWIVVSRSRERKGNLIVERLVDEYLNVMTSGQGEEASKKLEMLSYVGWLEEQRAGDHFTSDLVTFYKTAAPMQRALSLQARIVARSAKDHYYKVEFESALSLFEKAREMFSMAGNECEALFAQSWVGYCNLRIPRVKESLEIFGRLSQTYDRKSYLSLHAQSLYALSDAKLTLNEFSKALDYAERSLKMSEKIEDQVNVVRTRGQVASVLLNLGSHRESLGAALQGLSVAETIPYDPALLWRFYHEAALAYFHSGLPSTAFDCESEAERLADISRNSLLKARSLDRRALFYEQAGDYQTAIALLHQSLGEAEKISGELSRAVTQVHTTLSLGQLYYETGHFSQSVNYYDQTLKLSERLGDLQIYLYRAHKGKLVAFLGLHDDAAAAQELTTVISLFEAYREKIVDESYRNKFFDLGQSTYDIAIDFEVSRRANSEKAFEYAEASRARSLYDLMTNASRGSEASDRLDRSWVGTRPLLLSEVQSQMSDDAQILQYAVLADKVVMWVISKDGVRATDSKISASALGDTILRYRELLLRGQVNESPESTVLAKLLYEQLITPIETRGYLYPDREVCIVPDKSLNFLPFAALLSPASGRYLIENYALVLAPSSSIYVASSQNAKLRARRTSERLLIVGNPRFDQSVFSGLPDLPAADREARQIASLYNSIPLLGAEATLLRVRQELLSADVMHFATHAILDESSPFLSKLLLASERTEGTAAHHSSAGYLQASELYDRKLPRTRLAVLSACQTGIERAYGGEGAIGLARPFLAAGVPLVVASLWPVDSEKTAELMISFHKHRKEGHLSTTKALQRAQIDVIKSLPHGSRSPYTWAPFVPIGGYTQF